MFDFDLLFLYEITVIFLLLIVCYLLRFWSKNHDDTMDLIRHDLLEIRRKLDK